MSETIKEAQTILPMAVALIIVIAVSSLVLGAMQQAVQSANQTEAAKVLADLISRLSQLVPLIWVVVIIAVVGLVAGGAKYIISKFTG